jgi:glycosyltransferase involved in cell wall biosynthesis
LFQPLARSTIGLPDRYVFFFGALAAWQGIDCLLAAVTEPLWPAGVKLLIAGDGAGRKSVEEFASGNGTVVYLGPVPYATVPGILAGSLAGLSPKSNLGGRAGTGLSPLKVYETMACGVPVILSDFPGVADLVRASGAGITVPPADSSALAAAVELLARDENLRRRMGDSGRRLVEREHSWDCRAGATARVIDSVIPGAEPIVGSVLS